VVCRKPAWGQTAYAITNEGYRGLKETWVKSVGSLFSEGPWVYKKPVPFAKTGFEKSSPQSQREREGLHG
jgi:hypothetical protein